MKQSYSLGAEVAFVEGLLNEEQARKVVRELHPMPCLLNLATNGSTPNWTVKQAQEMGFKIVIFPLAGAMAAVHGMREAYREILESGTDVQSARGMGPKGFFEVVGLNKAMEIDSKAGGAAYHAYEKK
jgi:2-methylisocitrate lyase-like PEP mutase family enzyme